MYDNCRYYLPLIAVVLVAVFLNGCATIMVGGFLSQPKRLKIDKDAIDSNSIIRVTLMNGDKFVGRFKGFERSSTSKYVEKLSNFNQTNNLNINLPMPGQKIMVRTATNEISEVTFIGFDPGVIEVKMNDDAKAHEIELTSIVEMRYGNSNSMRGETLDRILRKVQIPFLSVIKMEWRSKELKFPVDIIKHIYKPRQANTLYYSAFAISVLADFLILNSILK